MKIRFLFEGEGAGFSSAIGSNIPAVGVPAVGVPAADAGQIKRRSSNHDHPVECDRTVENGSLAAIDVIGIRGLSSPGRPD